MVLFFVLNFVQKICSLLRKFNVRKDGYYFLLYRSIHFHWYGEGKTVVELQRLKDGNPSLEEISNHFFVYDRPKLFQCPLSEKIYWAFLVVFVGPVTFRLITSIYLRI